MDFPIQKAAAYGDTDEIIRLLQAGANINEPDENGNMALHNAAWNGHVETVQVLLNHGADVNAVRQAASTNAWTPLHFTAENDQFECARLLLDAGASINAKDQFGQTPLFLALDEMVSPNVAKLLIERGANLENALEIAENYVDMDGGLDVVEMLRQREAS
jgi:ankyrin repeat protein